MLRLLLLLTVSALSGCALLGSASEAPPTVVPAVTTAGTFAKAQTVLIPSGGLTVADLSEQVVRVSHNGTQGVPRYKGPSASKDGVPETSAADDRLSHKVVDMLYEDFQLDTLGERVSSQESDGLNLLTPQEFSTIRPDLLRCIRLFLSDTTSDETSLLRKLEDSSEDSSIDRDSLRASFQAVLVLGVLWNSDRSIQSQERTVKLWREEYSIGNKKRIDPDLPDVGNVVRQNISSLVASNKIASDLPFKSRLDNGIQFLKDLEGQLAGRQATQTTAAAGEIPAVASPPDPRVVSIRFQSGRKVSLPLFLIQETSAGDVLLSAGDRVEFIAMQDSSVFNSTANVDGNVLFVNRGREARTVPASTLTSSPDAFSSFLLGQSELQRTELSQGPDVVVVRRIEQSGNLHDFLLPITGARAFSDSAAASQMLREVRLRQGDQLYLDSLENLPIVRESRAAILRISTQQARAEAARIAFESKPLLEKLLHGPASILPNNGTLLRPQCDTIAAFTPPAISELQGRVKKAVPRPFQTAGDD